MGYELILDDVLRWAAGYTGDPFHCAFLDPPYHLTIEKRFGKPGSKPAKVGVYNRASKGFMNQSWDGTDESGLGIAFRPETWAALSQHLHPGGFILAFAGTRGYHRMACAMEDSGLIIHPAMVWTFLSGFPKATGIANQIDRAAGVEPAIIGRRPDHVISKKWRATEGREDLPTGLLDIKQPATPLAQTWAGHRYGLQALKPALEFIAVAQKPYEGRPVDCITRTGAGAWNIEAGRIPGPAWKWGTQTDIKGGGYGSKRPGDGDIYAEDIESDPGGRWPANLLLDEAGSALLDAQSGEVQRGSFRRNSEVDRNAISTTAHNPRNPNRTDSVCDYGDSGGASRMFFQSDWQYEILEQLENADPLKYEPKVSTAEREAGLDSLPLQTRHRMRPDADPEKLTGLNSDPKFAPTKMKNNHPTLKPISLTKYLATLILPPDAYAPRRLLVPFSGSGSEMIGAILAGFEEVVGIDSNPNYHEISKARLAWWSQWPGWGQTDVDKILASLGEDVPPEQLSLFEEA